MLPIQVGRITVLSALFLLVVVCLKGLKEVGPGVLAEKAVATHSSILAWRIPGTVEPGGLPSMGSHRVRHD